MKKRTLTGIDVYIYGMTVLSTIHRLKGDFPAPDSYQEILETHVIPGGEAANCTIVLANFGLKVRLDGGYLGAQTAAPLLDYFSGRKVDCSLLKTIRGFPGWQDIVFCAGETRTIFGRFGANLFGGKKLWNAPDEASIRQARCVSLDPFFGEESRKAAELCVRHATDYVAIDSRWEDAIARHARALVCSREFLDREYPHADDRQLLAEYRNACDGLVIFTFGGQNILYASPHMEEPAVLAPFRINVVDTLGAGDTFRAGVVYGILQRMPEDGVVRFAAACAGVACTRFPSVREPPALEEVLALMDSGTQ